MNRDEEDEDECDVRVAVFGFLLVLLLGVDDRRFWVHPMWESRDTFLDNFFLKLIDDGDKFQNFTRMSFDSFQILVLKVHQKIQKHSHRKYISPRDRLLVTLRFLATGDSFASLQYQFRMGKTTVFKIIKETCHVIWTELKAEHMPPLTKDVLENSAQSFQRLWNFPGCCGAIDGKHVRIRCPSHAGSQFFNYKSYHSIVIQAVSDANANFLAVDVGDYGRNSDAGIFRTTSFGAKLLSEEMELPGTVTIGERRFPPVFLGDEAYPLLKNLMRPFPRRDLDDRKRIFNYRHSRARRIVECAFGILTSKFRLFEGLVNLAPENADFVVLACCVLHNFIRTREGAPISASYLQGFNSAFSQDDDRPSQNGRPAREAIQIRENYCEYFLNEGRLPWQDMYTLQARI